jgi:hypothetical protein
MYLAFLLGGREEFGMLFLGSCRLLNFVYQAKVPVSHQGVPSRVLTLVKVIPSLTCSLNLTARYFFHCDLIPLLLQATTI